MMRPLVKKDTAGHVLGGSDGALLERARAGDDLTIFIESAGYDEYIIFGNYALAGGRVAGLSLAHLDHGDVPDPGALREGRITLAQYIYDSACNNVLVKDAPDEGISFTTVYAHNPSYRSYTWYSTREYAEAEAGQLAAQGDQFKLRLMFGEDFAMILKPSLVYFPHQGREYVVKSSAMLLPAEFAADPLRYVESGRRLVENTSFSLAYLTIDSNGRLLITHKRRFEAAGETTAGVREGAIRREEEGPTELTVLHCAYTLLAPGPPA